MNQPTIPELPEDLMDKWIVALESGEYQQTVGCLNRVTTFFNDEVIYPAGYCCMGVLCEVVGIPTAIDSGSTVASYYGEEYFPPFTVRDWLEGYGLDIEDLSLKNDDERLTFPQIAQYLRDKTSPQPIVIE